MLDLWKLSFANKYVLKYVHDGKLIFEELVLHNERSLMSRFDEHEWKNMNSLKLVRTLIFTTNIVKHSIFNESYTKNNVYENKYYDAIDCAISLLK